LILYFRKKYDSKEKQALQQMPLFDSDDMVLAIVYSLLL